MNAYLIKLNPLILAILILFFIPSAVAGTLSGPNSSSTGDYTISSIGNVCSDSYLSYQLHENNRLEQTGCSISKSFTGKPTGVYHYKLIECEYDPEINYNFCIQIHSHTVTVVLDGGGDNPNGDTEIRLGDYNNDGFMDIFVKPTITAPYLLKQSSYGSFQLITGLTTTQINLYSTWGIASHILAYVSDLNIDGTGDIMLVGINHYILAAQDQMIYSQYSSSSSSTAPASISTMTTSKKHFLIEALGLSQDRAYLLRTMIDNNAYSLTSHGFTYGYFNTAYLQLFQMSLNGSIYMPLDENPYDNSTAPSNCAFYNCHFDTIGGQWQMYVYAEVIDIEWDYSIFHQSTVNLAAEIDKVENGSSTLDKLLDIFENHLGYVSCNGIEDDQVDVFDNVHSFSYFRTNTCTFALLARHLNSMSIKEAIESGYNRVQFRANKINNDWWNPFYHSSISNSMHSDWFSGMPVNGKLVGLRRYVDDNPELTLLVGFVDSALLPQNLITELQLAQSIYDDTLEYTSKPSLSNNGYNSNSFTKGLVDLVGTIKPIGAFSSLGMKNTVEISINELRFPGLNKPVPKSKFGQ